jgi:flagellar motor protein MotB
MATNKYYSESELVQKKQSGEFGWLDYVNHHSKEWQNEYADFCKAMDCLLAMSRQKSSLTTKEKNLKRHWLMAMPDC